MTRHYAPLEDNVIGIRVRHEVDLASGCFILDDFSNSDSVTNYKYQDMELSGLDMNENNNVYNVSINKSSTASLILCQFQVFNRMLQVTNNGVSWVTN